MHPENSLCGKLRSVVLSHCCLYAMGDDIWGFLKLICDTNKLSDKKPVLGHVPWKVY